jgi:hypothetical protein
VKNLHALVAAENAAHTHGITDTGHTHLISAQTFLGNQSNQGLDNALSGSRGYTTPTISSASTGITINSQGSGTAHNTVQRSALVYWFMKL